MEKQDIMDEAAKFVPPAVISTMSIFGIGLQDWVYILTILYLLVQISLSVYKYIRTTKKKKDLKKDVKKDGQG